MNRIFGCGLFVRCLAVEVAVREYSGGMKVKTSVTLSSTLLEEIDGHGENRSAFLERAARLYLAQVAKSGRDAKDAEIIERRAKYLNEQAADVLEYQGLPG